MFEHTSRWDFLALLLSWPNANVITLVKPQLFDNPVLAWILARLNCVPAPRLEDRGTHGVARLVEKIQSLKHSTKPTLFCLSPKGTVMPAEWRSGYQHIAQKLGWPVRCASICFETRFIYVGPTHDANASDLEAILKYELAVGVPYRPQRSLLFSWRAYDTFEVLAPWDFTTVTLLAFLPALLIAGPVVQLVSASALYVSFVYHRNKESRLQVLDSVLAKLSVSIALIYAWQMSASWMALWDRLWPFGPLAAALYYAGTPRKVRGLRGPYIVWHSLFHLAAGALAWNLLAPEAPTQGSP